MGGEKVLHYMGTARPSRTTRSCRRSRRPRFVEDAPFDKICYIGCGVTTGIGAVINTAKVEPGSNVVVFGLGGIGLNVIQGARLVGADMIVGVDINPAREALGAQVRHDALRQGPKEVDGDRRLLSGRDLTGGGADYSFECIGNVNDHAPGAGVHCHKGWGERASSASPAPARRSPRGPSSWSPGGCWRGRTAFGGAKRPHSRCRRSSTGTWTALPGVYVQRMIVGAPYDKKIEFETTRERESA